MEGSRASKELRYLAGNTKKNESLTMITTCPHAALEASKSGEKFVIFNGDCRDLLPILPEGSASLIVSSPPYFLGKSYDTSRQIEGFEELHRQIAEPVSKVVTAGGSVCWQVGNHVRNGELVPLDFAVHSIFGSIKSLTLRNRIVWTFGHGTHAKKRFSGRHETILWYTSGPEYYFDLDAARIPQKYRGKKYYKGPNKGGWSSNPAGKNPGDVWDIPNVKANHVEKTEHPCQFPVALAQRLVVALTPVDGLVFDPFCGVGSAGIAAVMTGRNFLGAELDPRYCEIAEDRWVAVQNNSLKVRPLEKPVYEPSPNAAVARDPFEDLKGGLVCQS